MSAALPDVTIAFEGMARGGAELWGTTQADFVISRPGHAAKECAVLLNDAAAAYLAEQTGRENTAFFRAQAARAAGEALVHATVETGGALASIVMVARATLVERPALVAACRDLPPDPPPAEE